jgi:hypothetical protein
MNDATMRDEYDAISDFAGSLSECYRAVRARIAAGGPLWVPQDRDAASGLLQRLEQPQTPVPPSDCERGRPGAAAMADVKAKENYIDAHHQEWGGV